MSVESNVEHPAEPRAAIPFDTRSVPPMLYWGWSLLLLVPILLPKYLATEDGLAHLYWVEVFRDLGRPGSPFAEYYVRHVSWGVPHHFLYFGLQYSLGAVLEPHLAQKLIVSAIVLFWCGSIWFLSRAMTGSISAGALAALLLIHSSWLYNGLFAFMSAIPFLLVILGMLTRLANGSTPATRVWPYLVIALLGLVTHFAHFFVGALFLLLGLLWLVFPWRPIRFSRTYLAMAMMPTAILAVWYLAQGALGSGGLRWEPFVTVLARFFGLAFFRGFGAPTPSFWIALATFGVVVAFLCWRGTIGHPFRTLGQHQRFVIVLAGLLCVAYFFAPASVGEAWPFHSRLHFAALAWLLPSLQTRLGARERAALLILLSLLLGWQVATFSARGVRLSHDYEPVLQAADSISSGSTLASSMVYESARYERSFVRVLASMPEDIAERRKAILLDSFFPAHAYYWVLPRAPAHRAVDARIGVESRPDGRIELEIRRNQ